MESEKLSPRLAAIAAMVPRGARLADVGTDHGLLPVWLLKHGYIRSAVATDIRPGPLSRAEENRASAGISPRDMRCILCDGLEGIAPTDADTVVIAGLGGENMTGILENASWARSGALLILQPMTHPEVLRTALSRWGLRITRECLVLDSGRIYSILGARTGTDESMTEAETYTGRYALIAGDPLFPRYLREWRERTDRALEGLASSRREEDLRRFAHLRLVRLQLGEMEEQYAHSL